MLYDHEKMMLLDNFDWKNHILERLIFDKELHMKDDDSLLEENGEQQNSNIQGEEWFWLIWSITCIDKTPLPCIQHRR